MFRRLAAVLSVLVLLPMPTAQAAVGTWSAPARLYAASDIQGTGYSYAPSAVAGDPLRLYTCHSRSTGTVRDDIFLTQKSGPMTISSRSMLTSSASGWDRFHICDPSVVRVNVPFNGRSYSYAMFYLGNDVDASAHNAIGVAVADSLDGPWVKMPNPVVPFAGSDPGQWGAGQPTATTIDPVAGTVVLAWTEGYSTGTFGRAAQVSFGSGTPVLSRQRRIPAAGLTDSTGASDWLNNFDLAYSPRRDRFYLVREGHPYPSSNPNYISDRIQLASMSGTDFWNGTGSWTVEGWITSATTGKARTHNPGLLRSIYGTLPDESTITVVYTSADPDPGSLWTYTLWQTTAALS
ncbi:hypothetical protein Kfla_4520 [Kribbella flavida DSM 17836]|uniref:Uncharacterized protein n=1 Tax=Kribbella flavida (strain DSM 17836 / JCM 10339 / NBRC 14399) TaxID=479435 RepID=D2PWS8_KRIFD|nr:hypothetical protein [Kribbella flavida]ADB33547.1 hypothetical protein Kfla_4520 [Kribbella flavida DSM 17836]